MVLGVISNLRRDMNELCKQLGLEPYLSFCITSAEAGAEKTPCSCVSRCSKACKGQCV